MSEYSKKLHIRKDGTVDDITLYTDTSGFSGGALTLRDGSNIVYAALGSTTDSEASRLRVRKSGTAYAVLKTTFSHKEVRVSKKQWGNRRDPDIREDYTVTIPPQATKVKIIEVSGGNWKYIKLNSGHTIKFTWISKDDGEGGRYRNFSYQYNNKWDRLSPGLETEDMLVIWGPDINNS